MKRTVIVIAVVFMLVLAGAGASFIIYSKQPQKAPQTIANTAKLKIAATIFALADIARNVGGEKTEVIAIFPPGTSPHTFEPTPNIIKKLAGVKLLFKIGHGLDDWAQKTADSLGEAQVLAADGGINLRTTDGSVDPHYWLNFENAAQIAQNISDALSAADPENKNFYAANLADYKKQLSAADNELKAKLSALKNKAFATFHEAWFYFADHYGLEVAAAFEPFPGKEPTPEFLAHFIDTVKEKNIKVIFSEPEFSPAAIEQVARDLNVALGVLNPIEGTWRQNDTYISLMKENVNTIFEALNR